MTTIPHNRPQVAEDDVAAVSAVLRSGWLAAGEQVAGLEADFAALTGSAGSCAVSSGTAALYLALRGLGVGEGDAVVVPTYSCSALLNAVNFCGARPLPADVRAGDFTLDPGSAAGHAGTAKAAVAVHTFGATADVPALQGLGLRVVEDCCQSLGGPQGRTGDAAIASFYATKIITCGHGGILWDRAGAVAAWARDFREFDCRETYVPRFNFHLTDFQAAMVRRQLSRLDAIRERRRAIRRRLLAALGAAAVPQAGLDDERVLPYRCAVRFASAAQRDEARARLAEDGIKSIVPIERFELLHRYLGLDPEGFPVAEALADTVLSLPLYPALTDAETERLEAALAGVAAAVG